MRMGLCIDISWIPWEIMEYIFDFLSDSDISSAALVSPAWREMSERSFRHRCLKSIPRDILTEIASEQKYGNVDWTSIWFSNLRPDFTSNRSSVVRLHGVARDSHLVSSVCVHKDTLYTGTKDGCIIQENIQGGGINSVRTHDGGVSKLTFLPFYSLLVGSGETELHFYKTSPRLKKLGTDFSIRLGTCKHVSVFGPMFSFRDIMGSLQIFEIFYVGQVVRTTKLFQITQTSEILRWEIWKDKVICLLSTGEICVHSLLLSNASEVYRSECYTAVLYRNPSWIFRDVVFVSSLASRGVLEERPIPHTYVYMSDMWGTRNGTGPWYIGDLEEKSDSAALDLTGDYEEDEFITATSSKSTIDRMMRGFCLQKQFIGCNLNCDVTALCMKRSYLLCGTYSGTLFMFNVDGSSLIHSSTEFERRSNPDWKLRVSDQIIQSVHLSFSDGLVHAVYESGGRLGTITFNTQFTVHRNQPSFK